jgi:hypothetical protein
MLVALVAVVFVPQSVRAQDCTLRDLSAALQPNEKVYGHALELSQDLQRGGFVVSCVLRSHWEGLFVGLVGAALYRTDRGDFEVLFLDEPDTFDQLIVHELLEGDRWVYSFEGQPKPWSTNRMEGRKMYFVKAAHRLLVAMENEALAAALRRLLAPPATRRIPS